MLGYLKLLLILPVALVLILLAVANRTSVLLSLDPFARGAPELAFAIPLYGLLFGTFALGMMVGGASAWLSGSRHRRTGRTSRRENRRLREEADRLRSAMATSQTPALPRPGLSA